MVRFSRNAKLRKGGCAYQEINDCTLYIEIKSLQDFNIFANDQINWRMISNEASLIFRISSFSFQKHHRCISTNHNMGFSYLSGNSTDTKVKKNHILSPGKLQFYPGKILELFPLSLRTLPCLLADVFIFYKSLIKNIFIIYDNEKKTVLPHNTFLKVYTFFGPFCQNTFFILFLIKYFFMGLVTKIS